MGFSPFRQAGLHLSHPGAPWGVADGWLMEPQSEIGQACGGLPSSAGRQSKFSGDPNEIRLEIIFPTQKGVYQN